jgi:hypothetical protein
MRRFLLPAPRAHKGLPIEMDVLSADLSMAKIAGFVAFPWVGSGDVGALPPIDANQRSNPDQTKIHISHSRVLSRRFEEHKECHIAVVVAPPQVLDET